MGTNADKRARQRDNRTAAAAAQPGGAPRSRALLVGITLAVVAVVAVVVFAMTRDDSTSTKAARNDATTTSTVDILPAPAKGVALSVATPCPPQEGSAKRVSTFAGAPPMCIDPATTKYSATFDTTEGSFTAELDAATSPVTVNNFVVLSRYHYYDGVPFHRIVPNFVIQAGDGDGPPWGQNQLGYTVPDELPTSADAYKDYSLAMANAGPNTGASQFFVILPGGGARLGPNYSPFGQVTQGQDVVDKIGALGDAQEKPTKAVVINKVTISEAPRQ